ncbi:ABC transporter substrate-binding protein [Fundidesulfovibrio terrae]|uniref:ABC transporter substrate-binding protein n=1 Tax=Fundidesulfovibrio terrae TaxID=2922866 RepID=UPI001FAE88FA
MRTILALLAAGLSALSISAQAVKPALPVIVGATVSESGGYASSGDMYAKGLRMWAQDVNERGGILGRKVELLLKDDESNPGKTEAAYETLASPHGADLILGPDHARLALAALPPLEKAKVPAVFPVATSDVLWKDGKGLAFGVQSPLSEWPAGYFELISRSGIDTVSMLVVDHPTSEEVIDNITTLARRYGMDLSAKVSTGLQGLPAAIAQIVRDTPRALTIWGSQEGCTEALRELKRSGCKPKSLYVSSGQGTNRMLLEFPGRDLEGLFTSTPWDVRIAGAYPDGLDFAERFRATQNREPDHLAACGYAAGQVLEAAAAKARSLAPEKIRKALAELETLTILGRYAVDPTGMQLRQFPVTVQWQKGKREIVWPEMLRTAKPALSR